MDERPSATADDRAPLVAARVTVPGSATEVWDLITRPASLSAWFTRCFPSSAKSVTFEFDEPEGVHIKSAVVLECHPCRALRVRWEDPGYPDSEVRVVLHPDGSARTQVLLTHIQVPTSLLEGYRTGWAEYLDQLRALADDDA